MGITPHNERPEECRDTCNVAQCEGSGCRFLHDEAHPVRVPPVPDHIGNVTEMVDDKQGTLIVEVPYVKKEGRHIRRET